MMRFISEVKMELETDDILIPILDCQSQNSNLFAKFTWKNADSCDTFFSRYSHYTPGYDWVYFFDKSKENKNINNADLKIKSWEVLDDNKKELLLIGIDEITEWRDISKCFCIPNHFLNLLEVYSYFLKIYPVMTRE